MDAVCDTRLYCQHQSLEPRPRVIIQAHRLETIAEYFLTMHKLAIIQPARRQCSRHAARGRTSNPSAATQCRSHQSFFCIFFSLEFRHRLPTASLSLQLARLFQLSVHCSLPTPVSARPAWLDPPNRRWPTSHVFWRDLLVFCSGFVALQLLCTTVGCLDCRTQTMRLAPSDLVKRYVFGCESHVCIYRTGEAL